VSIREHETCDVLEPVCMHELFQTGNTEERGFVRRIIGRERRQGNNEDGTSLKWRGEEE